MKYKPAIIVIISVLSLMLLNNSACTQEKNSTPEKLASMAKTSVDNGDNAVAASESKVIYVESVSKPVPGKAVDFTWKEDGKVIKFSEYTKNKVVFINFWATWCGPCRKEIPSIVQLSKELANKDFVIIGIACERDPSSAQNMVKSFAQSNGITYINFLDVKNELANNYGGISAIPTTYIIDKNGAIAETILGGQDKDSFLNSINRVLR